jgi:hypothetical protein
MLVIPGPTWHKAAPITASATVDNIGGTAGATAVAIINRSLTTAVTVGILFADGDSNTFPIPAAGALVGCDRWKRVLVAGTTVGADLIALY